MTLRQGLGKCEFAPVRSRHSVGGLQIRGDEPVTISRFDTSCWLPSNRGIASSAVTALADSGLNSGTSKTSAVLSESTVRRTQRTCEGGICRSCARVPAVDPTIAAAWITGGVGALGIAGTVTITIVGFRATRNATGRALAASAAATSATLSAGREDRLWEKRAAAYEETLAEVRHRQLKRRHDLRGFRWDEASEQQRNDFFASYQPPNWFQAQARMAAYASDTVLDAFEGSEQAHLEVWMRYQRYRTMADDNKLASESGRPGVAHDGHETVAARKAVDPAVEEAEAMDQALVKLIRDELRSKPEAAALPAAVPTRRQMFWQRH